MARKFKDTCLLSIMNNEESYFVVAKISYEDIAIFREEYARIIYRRLV